MLTLYLNYSNIKYEIKSITSICHVVHTLAMSPWLSYLLLVITVNKLGATKASREIWTAEPSRYFNVSFKTDENRNFLKLHNKSSEVNYWKTLTFQTY